MSKVFPLLKLPLRSWDAIHSLIFFIWDESLPCYSSTEYSPNQQFITIGKKVLNDIQSAWLGFNTNLSVIYGKLESQASFTLNGKCALPSCGWNINNTEGLHSPSMLPLPFLGFYAFWMAWLRELELCQQLGAFKRAYQRNFGTQITETCYLGSICLCPPLFYDFFFNCKTKLWVLASCVEYIVY